MFPAKLRAKKRLVCSSDTDFPILPTHKAMQSFISVTAEVLLVSIFIVLGLANAEYKLSPTWTGVERAQADLVGLQLASFEHQQMTSKAKMSCMPGSLELILMVIVCRRRGMFETEEVAELNASFGKESEFFYAGRNNEMLEFSG